MSSALRLQSRFRARLGLFGPAFIASVAYVDPGNFAANLSSGSQCGYSLLWVVVVGNLIALLVQTLSCRLGIFSGTSLAKNCGDYFPPAIKLPLWIISELMSVATELAEVLGAGIGIGMIFHTPLLTSCIAAGVLSFLPFLKRGDQKFLEKLMSAAVLLVGLAFGYELLVVRPDWLMVARGTVVPTLNSGSAVMAASMLGATVMPHVIFLHSGLISNSQSQSAAPKTRYRFAIFDNLIALNIASVTNAAMVITFAAICAHSAIKISTIESVSQMLGPMFGKFSSVVLGLALIVSGLGSTTVGSMAGQIILDGFFNVRIPLWCRRAITLLPCLFIVQIGMDSTHLIVLSQAALSLALPFTMVPLLWLNRSKAVMGADCLTGTMFQLSVIATASVIILNGYLLWSLLPK